MADTHDKEFDPTPRRLAKAREEGNLFKSQETTSVGMLAVGTAVVVFGMPVAFDALQRIMVELFLGAAQPNVDIDTFPSLVGSIGMRMAGVMIPFFAVLLVAAVSLNLVQSGWNLTLKPLQPKPDKMSPLKGLKRIFSSKGLFELFKALIKIGIVAPVAYLNVKGHLPEILMLHTHGLPSVIGTTTTWIIVLLAQMIALFLVLSAIDFAYSKWKYKKDLKMSMQEIKDETKDQEGNAEVKGKQRQRAKEISRRARLDHAVLKADVVVTNPTHYAVALRYDPGEADAPRVVAKGIRKRALRIKELARENDIPTVEDRPLARALYASVDEDQTIPEELYPAVAAILAEIYRKKNPTR